MAKNDRSVDWLTIKHFWQVGRSYRPLFAGSWLTIPSALGLTVLVPYFIGKILGGLAHSDAHLGMYIYGLVIVGVFTVITNQIAYRALFSLQPIVMAHLQAEILDALLKRGVSFHNNRVSGKLVSDSVDYPLAFNQLSSSLFTDILPFIAIVILGIILVSINSPLMGLILVCMTILAVGSGIRFRRKMTPFRLKRHALGKQVVAHLADTIVNNQTVKSFGNEAAELKQHTVLGEKFKDARLHDWLAMAYDGSYRIAGLLLFQVTFILIVVQEVHTHPALLATGIFAFSYTMTLSNRLFQIGMMLRTVEEALLLAVPMTEMLQEEAEIQDKPGAAELHVDTGRIAFKDMIFFYNDNPRQDKVFAGLNLDIKPGEKVGLVGPSGGGKTTLTKLLLRFEDIQGGTITIDGQDISTVTQTSLRRSIAYVPQEPLLFHRSINENIAYAHPDAGQTAIKKAARQAHADDFIQHLPNGYDTVVGERGIKLSGGQRQRIAIARAILKDAPILVLDEATSALDSESEVAIQAALWELMQARTAIVVAHRLSTIQRMDRIVVLDDGKIVEQGTHKELLKKNGLYAKLWSHQSGGFIEE